MIIREPSESDVPSADAFTDAPASRTPAAETENLTKRFDTVTAVDNVSLSVKPGETFFLLGPSGCGKTTLLRLLAGLETPDSGVIRMFGEDVCRRPPHLRGAPMVFQHYALWPHMNVADNVAFGLVERGLERGDIARRVSTALDKVKLTGYEKRRPSQLSGGQQQRVALARALVLSPGLLLLDEPLANLDAHTRQEMRLEMARLGQASGIAFVYVTHDQAEALALADRIAIMSDGKLIAVDKPDRLYHRPPDRFTAGFLGDLNTVSGDIRERHDAAVIVNTPFGPWTAVGDMRSLPVGVGVDVLVRPENIRLAAASEAPSANKFEAEVMEVRPLGATIALTVRPRGVQVAPWRVTVLNRPGDRWKTGEFRWFALPGDATIVLAGDRVAKEG